MILDSFDTRRVLRRNLQRTPFLLVLYKTPEMYDAILDNDVFQEHMRPRLHIEIGEKPLTNCAIIKAGRPRNIDCRESLQQIAARHNADEPAVLDNGDAFDPMAFQRSCDLSKRSCRRYSDHVRGVGDREALRCEGRGFDSSSEEGPECVCQP
jgi:hypothetical protein